MNQCDWGTTSFLIFSENVPAFIYYSHLLPFLASLVLAFFVLVNNPRALLNRILFFVVLFFGLWVYFDLILWASPLPELVMFFWSAIVPIEMLMYASSFYLVLVLANNKNDISLKKKILIALFFIPIILFTHTRYNLIGLSPDCDEGVIEGALIQYMYIVEVLFIIFGALTVVKGYTNLNNQNKNKEAKELLFVGLGVIIFLISFTIGNITLIFSINPEWEQYKLFGMPIFVALVAYSIVKFKAFNSKILPAQVLVVALWILTFSVLFLHTLSFIRIIVAINVLLVSVIGFFLIRSVKSEVAAKQNLQKANEQQESLMRFINHQVKGFLTRSRLIFDALKNDEYGKLSPEAKKLVDVGFDTNTQAVQMVKSLLDASNLQDGTVNYQHVNFDFRALVSDIIGQLKPTAESKGLNLNSQIDSSKEMMVNGDLTHLAQAVRNLIENSIQYTNAGAITVSLNTTPDKKVIFKVEDTGLGLSEEDKRVLFKQGGRGEEAQRRNVNSTGYGLYITYKIVKDHNGHIKASSAGRDKGSTFEVVLPLV